PLTGMPLEELRFPGTRVTDLGPLREMKSLRVLSTRATPVRSLEPVRGLPLEYLEVGSGVTDFSPLQGAPLHTLLVPPDVAAANRKILQTLPKLKTINYQPAEAFWKALDEAPPKK